MTVPTIDLVFDGHCAFCTRAANWIERLDRAGRVRLHPLQRPGVLERFGLTEGEALTAAWVFEADAAGRPLRPLRGAAAVNRAIDAALGTRVCSALYRVPGIWWIEDLAYQWIADHRSWFPGATPWCAANPGDCAEAPGGAAYAPGGMGCTVARR